MDHSMTLDLLLIVVGEQRSC